MTTLADLEAAPNDPKSTRWDGLAGPRTAFTHGPELLALGPTGTVLGPLYDTTGEAAEDARRYAALHQTNRVVYKLVPVSWHRALSGRIEG